MPLCAALSSSDSALLCELCAVKRITGQHCINIVFCHPRTQSPSTAWPDRYKVEPKCHREFAKKYLETRKELEGEQGNKKMKLFKVCIEPPTASLTQHQLRTSIEEGISISFD